MCARSVRWLLLLPFSLPFFLVNVCSSVTGNHIDTNKSFVNNVEKISDSVVNFYVGAAHSTAVPFNGNLVHEDNDSVQYADYEEDDSAVAVARSISSTQTDLHANEDTESVSTQVQSPKTAMKLMLENHVVTLNGTAEIITKQAIVEALRAFKDTPCTHHEHSRDVKCMLLMDIIRDLTLLGLTFSSDPVSTPNHESLETMETTDRD